MIATDRSLNKAPIAEMKVDAPQFAGVTQAIDLRDFLFQIVMGNIPGTRKPHNPDCDR